MARRPRGEEDDVSLFPFLSILACVIGTLTLMISGLALGQMDNETVASAEEYEEVNAELAAAQEELDLLAKQFDSEKEKAENAVTDRQRELVNKRTELTKLTVDLDAKREESRQPMEVVVIPKVDRLMLQRADDLKQQLDQLNQRIATLKAQIAERKLPPKESQVKVMPGGSGVGFVPVFVECAGTSIVLHNTKKPVRVPAAQIRSHKGFRDLLTDVAGNDKKTVVFLIRTDGLTTFRTARAAAEARDARNGKLPIVGKGRLDLAFFANKG